MASNGRVLLMAPSPEAPQTPGRYFDRKLKPVGILSPFPDCFELKERFDFNLGPVVHGFTGSPCSGLTYAHNVGFQQKYVDMALGRLEPFRMFLTADKHPALCVYFVDGVSAYVMPMVEG